MKFKKIMNHTKKENGQAVHCAAQKKMEHSAANHLDFELRLASDWFKCEDCGYTVRMLVRGDRVTCSQCGGTMERC